MAKVPVICCDSYIIYIEEVNKNYFIHCDVLTKWTKSVKMALKASFDLLTKECGKELYALHTPEDKKHEKFLKMFSFSYLNSFIGNDGNNYDIYVWR